MSKIVELQPYVESVLWGCQKLNLSCVDKFITFLNVSFGPAAVGELSKSVNIKEDVNTFKSSYNST